MHLIPHGKYYDEEPGENLRRRHFRTAYLELLERLQPVELPNKAVESLRTTPYISITHANENAST